MNITILIALMLIAGLIVLVALFRLIDRRPASDAAATPQGSSTNDPALPEVQTRAVERLLRLPHFRRILDGSLFDFYQGARLKVCDCDKLAYPHLLIEYSDNQGLIFETAAALEHYVEVQEAVSAMLMRTRDRTTQPAREGH